MASTDLVSAAWKAPTNNVVADADCSWPPLSQASPSKHFGDEKKTKEIRLESQPQQLPFSPYQTTHNSSARWQNQFMPPPRPLPPASSIGVPRPVYVRPPSQSPSPSDKLRLRQKIIQQIEYYFSDDNLAKDVYLRSKMDDKGWVGVYIIATFPRVSQLTNYCEVILDCMRYSNSVELGVKTGKLRQRANWSKWILQPSLKDSNLLPSNT